MTDQFICHSRHYLQKGTPRIMIDYLIVTLIVAVVGFFVIRSFYRTFRKDGDTKCGGCSGCDIQLNLHQDHKQEESTKQHKN
jgi:hypothetical protein